MQNFRQMRGVWGRVEIDDHAMFLPAQGETQFIAGACRNSAGLVFWIVTEAERGTQTTVSMPEDIV